ncbi:hypothetical protein [Streptomyces sp. UH6]|uniref:hypothetical protein n=1 Tax=Streptomyces sp. UH6 TaxID=2748379 RepID=UPI0015D4B38E|nr:hypothetical protein [Streptomyces sp. UH6]NYV73953.1 hypothetical protein [Streptomyces sp. UH6]
MPETVCGTRIAPGLVRPLLSSTDGLDEYSRVDRNEAVSAPCTLRAEGEQALALFFYWTDEAPKVTEPDHDPSGFQALTGTKPVHIGGGAVVGKNGGVVTTPCRTAGGKHFTLKLYLPQVAAPDIGHRADVERFMRAYFPATVETLNCR